MNRPNLFKFDIWSQWESGILSLLSEALSDLHNATNVSNCENEITYELYKIVRTVKFNQRLIAFGSVFCQTQNQPVNPLGVPENELSLRKKPDLQWVFNDENATSAEKSQRYFTIECKCLTDGTTQKDYVEKGISRFVLDEWGYGRYEKSAAMIGYIKEKDISVHLDGVNKHNIKHCYPVMCEVSRKAALVFRYTQGFETREFEPRKFTLHHLWTHIGN